MASGFKELQINTQERAVSVDINRLQKFKSADLAEIFRYMLNVQGIAAGQAVSADLDAGGVITEPNTVGTPVVAEIMNGLLVKPQPGTLNLLVDPGVGWFMSPDAAADDSNYKYAKDPGVTVAGTLVMTTNGAGSLRIDVVEAQIGNVVSETDNRDIFNPTTGLFTAQTVTKARQDSLTYRVRAGVAGSGYPAAVSGWTPLCVAVLPAGAATVDAMDFYDVRPLVADRVRAPFNAGYSRHVVRKLQVNALALATTIGWIEVDFATGLGGSNAGAAGGRKVGGRLRSGAAGVADADSIDLTAAANRENAFALVANRPWYLYLCFPFGLPRWSRYTRSGTRLPRNPIGIPLVSSTAPDSDGNPIAALNLPGGAAGLPGSVAVQYAVCVAQGNNSVTPTMFGLAGDNDNGFVQQIYANGGAGQSGGITGAFTLTAGVDFPACAKSIFVTFSTTFSLSGTTTALVTCTHNLTVTQPAGAQQTTNTVTVTDLYNGGTAANSATPTFGVWIDLYPFYQAGTGNPPIQNYTITVNTNPVPGAAATISATNASVKAYKL